MKKIAVLLISLGIIAALASDLLLYQAARLSSVGIHDLTRLSFVILLVIFLTLYVTRNSRLAIYGMMASGIWALSLLGISVLTGFRIGQSIPHLPHAIRIPFNNLVRWSDILWIVSWVFQAVALWPLFSQLRGTRGGLSTASVKKPESY